MAVVLVICLALLCLSGGVEAASSRSSRRGSSRARRKKSGGGGPKVRSSVPTGKNCTSVADCGEGQMCAFGHCKCPVSPSRLPPHFLRTVHFHTHFHSMPTVHEKAKNKYRPLLTRSSPCGRAPAPDFVPGVWVQDGAADAGQVVRDGLRRVPAGPGLQPSRRQLHHLRHRGKLGRAKEKGAGGRDRRAQRRHPIQRGAHRGVRNTHAHAHALFPSPPPSLSFGE